MRLGDVRTSSKWVLHGNHCYIAEKRSTALPVERPPFNDFCRIVDHLVQQAKVTRGLSGNALLFKLRQQFPKWSIDKSYVEDAFLSNQFAAVIRNTLSHNQTKSTLRNLYMSAHHFCLQQAMKYIYLQVEKKPHYRNKKQLPKLPPLLIMILARMSKQINIKNLN